MYVKGSLFVSLFISRDNRATDQRDLQRAQTYLVESAESDISTTFYFGKIKVSHEICETLKFTRAEPQATAVLYRTQLTNYDRIPNSSVN